MKPISILVADDEPSMRLNLSEILEAEGYSVLESETGHQAIEHSLRYHPRVILMDIKMPQMSGLKALRILDRKSTRLNSSHVAISYAVFCLQKKNLVE